MKDLKHQRFKQRLQNLENAVSFLEETIASPANDRIREAAMIKAYEMAFELSWKTLKDFLEYGGFTDPKSPRDVLKTAFQQGYLTDGKMWIQMLEERNELSHIYQAVKSKSSAKLISETYLSHLQELLKFLRKK